MNITLNKRIKKRSYSFDDASLSSLLKLYEQTTNELQKLREFEWKIAATFVTFTGALIALILSDKILPILNMASLNYLPFTNPVKALLTILQICVGLFGLWCLWVTHSYVTTQRVIRREVESKLGFHRPGIYGLEAVLPIHFSTKKGFGFQLIGLILPLSLLIILTQALSIFLIWNVV